ncbi:MAG: sulfatase-like hydrolase/transferase [Pseudobdellovibrionaceae bacterium]
MRTVKASSIIVTLLALALSLVLLSCQSSTKPSILVIAVDDLSVLDILCNEDMTHASKSGFEILCKESVRFTHAFNPSVLTVPTLASILTGVYPFQHRVHHNGQPGLDPQFVTVAEAALEKNYRTALFSGGPPVWRKSGLNQGFELFDDNIIPSRQSLYRPFSITLKSLLQWIRQDVGPSSPFFATVYVPDLIFTNTVTINEFGEARNLSHESQLDELDSNLFKVFRELKALQRWDSTTLILVGLNGYMSDDRPGELNPSNLHSENTQVALFIKPPQRSHDEALQWKVDRNVSLVDLGESLFELMAVPQNPNKPAKNFPVYSLSPLVQNKQTEETENRLLLLESDWPQWRGFSNRRSAVLCNHTLFIYDQNPLAFNTLTDREETHPLRSSEIPGEERQRILNALETVEAEPWMGYGKEVVNKYTPAFFRWMRPDQKTTLLKDLKTKINGKNLDPEILNWTALLSFELKDWNSLKALSQKAEQPFWQFVADKNGASETNVRFNMFQDLCLRLLEIPRIDSLDLKKCNNPLFLDFIRWHRADLRNFSKNMQKRRFERAYLNFLVDQNIKQGNLATTMIWDTPDKFQPGPELVDLVLSLPEFQKQRNALMKALQNSNNWQDED